MSNIILYNDHSDKLSKRKDNIFIFKAILTFFFRKFLRLNSFIRFVFMMKYLMIHENFIGFHHER
jgi:hypothetical protein